VLCHHQIANTLRQLFKHHSVIIPLLPEGGGGYTVLPLSVLLSVQDIFCRIFLSNCWWQKSDIWSQASCRYPISWEAFLDPSDSYFLFADLVGFYTHWTYMLIFRHIFQIPTSCLPKSGGIISEHYTLIRLSCYITKIMLKYN
jgi:hypothetical protein